MTGDCHVRICGSPGVRFPRATRPHLVPSIAEMSYPSTIIKYMFDIRQLDDSSGTITPAPGPAPGSGRQAISTTGPAADPGPPGAALPLERLGGAIRGTAGQNVRGAGALRDLPVLRAGFAAARLSYAKVRALTRIATPATEQGLAEIAGPMTGNQLERFARAHRQVTAADDTAARIRRRLAWRFEDDGSLAGTFRLSPLAGAVLLKALRAAAGDLGHPHHDHGGVSAETPRAPRTPGHPADPARCHVQDGPAVSVSTAQMIACTAALSWMLHDRDGTILDAGRRRRRPTSAQHRAARDRDRGRFPGCESRRVDPHHSPYWSQIGQA